MRMAKGGQLRGRVTEDQLIGVLDQVEAAEKGRAGGAAGGGGGAGKIVVRARHKLPSCGRGDCERASAVAD